MRRIDLMVIHCADTRNGDAVTAADIDAWHYERGFRRDLAFRRRQNRQLAAIGYHFVYYTNGGIATGRHIEEVGAHAHGHNHHSIGGCLIGRDKFTLEEWEILRANVSAMQRKFPGLRVIGHREINSKKTCPGFDVQAWLAGDMEPLAGHILRPDPPKVPAAPAHPAPAAFVGPSTSEADK